MKRRYTDRDLSRFFIHFKSIPDTIELSNIIQTINNPASHTKIEGGISNALNLKLLLWIVGGISLIAIIAIFLNNTGKYLPADVLHYSVVVDSTKEDAIKTNVNSNPDTLILEHETSFTEKIATKSETRIILENNTKMESKEVSVSKNTLASICYDYSDIDTSLNYFKLNDTIYEIKSCSQFKEADWKSGDRLLKM